MNQWLSSAVSSDTVPEVWQEVGVTTVDEVTNVVGDETDKDSVTMEEEEDDVVDDITVDDDTDDEDEIIGVFVDIKRSFHLDSKNFLMVWPPLPTSDSSSLNVLQFSKISLQSTANSALFLYL